jgi:hypothetical protein
MRHFKIVYRRQASRPLDPEVPPQWEYYETCACGVNLGWPCPLAEDEDDAEPE